MVNTAQDLVEAAADLARQTGNLRFGGAVEYVYRPLDYAWAAHEMYLRKHGNGEKRVIFLGMNPGPFGMAQTGVPFGEVAAVRDWVGVEAPIGKPERECPKRPITGFACKRSEVSGKRLWGLFAKRFGTAGKFFREHFVVNYCPLVFMDENGRNLTPDKFKGEAAEAMFAACDTHLRRVAAATRAEWVIGVGAFAEGRARRALEGHGVAIGRIPHPSPASPLANKNWAGLATAALVKQGVWE
jgi:single-strand selective monofunctional uracil DNA glycosylase